MAPVRRYRELAFLLPLAGLILFMPPYLWILSRDEQLAGIPVLHIYIFAVWLLGIFLSAVISRQLVRNLVSGEDSTRQEMDEHRPDQS